MTDPLLFCIFGKSGDSGRVRENPTVFSRSPVRFFVFSVLPACIFRMNVVKY